jgi:hypothetical protein
MSDNTPKIKAIMERMKTSDEAYRSGALEIWDLLSEDERGQLKILLHRRPHVHRNEVLKNDAVDRLMEYGLATWRNDIHEYYIVGTFVGFSVLRIGERTPANVTLPGESKS